MLDERKGVWKSGRGRGRDRPKGRQLDDAALDEIRRLLGDRPRRRDLLIEFLHLIQDAHGHLSAAHLRALAEEMRLAQAEVYEVATFYAHFDVVKEGEAPPPNGAHANAWFLSSCRCGPNRSGSNSCGRLHSDGMWWTWIGNTPTIVFAGIR